MKTALLVLDAQNIYTDSESELYCDAANETIRKINMLVDRFSNDNNAIFLIRHIHSTDGTDLGRMFDYLGESEEDFNFKSGTEEVGYDDSLHRPPNVVEIIKTRYSAFANTDLEKKLRKAKIERVVVCGFMTNCCCDSTAREAHDKDFFVDFIIDATGTPGTDNYDQVKVRKITRDFMEAGYARVMTTKESLALTYS
jgi:ureidoacrylate peracid hydrolase